MILDMMAACLFRSRQSAQINLQEKGTSDNYIPTLTVCFTGRSVLASLGREFFKIICEVRKDSSLKCDEDGDNTFPHTQTNGHKDGQKQKNMPFTSVQRVCSDLNEISSFVSFGFNSAAPSGAQVIKQ